MLTANAQIIKKLIKLANINEDECATVDDLCNAIAKAYPLKEIEKIVSGVNELYIADELEIAK